MSSRSGTTKIAFGALFATVALAAILACAEPARAQSTTLGPGPFSTMRLDDSGIVITVDSSAPSAVPFTGTVSVGATRGAVDWTPFDQRAVVGQNGMQLTQRGAVGGVPVDAYFPEGEQRRIRIRNGDGRATEIDVDRIGNAFYARSVNRSPGEPGKTSSRSTSGQLDALADSSLTIELETQSSTTGLDVVVAMNPSDLPSGIDSQFPSIVAVDESGAIHGAYGFGYGRTATFHHLSLPPGEYTLRVSNAVSLGNPVTSYSSLVTLKDVVTTHVTVSAESRLFAVTVPPLELPTLSDTTVTVDGLAQFGLSFSNRLDFNLLLVSSDGLVQLNARRDLCGPEPLSIPLRLPPGEYTASCIAFHDDNQQNGRTYYLRLVLGTHTIEGGATTFSIPPLVRVTGSLIDPSLVLASQLSSQLVSSTTQVVYLTPVDAADTSFTAQATMRGFARSYSAFVPRGVPFRPQGSLTIGLGRVPERFRSFLNGTGTLQVPPRTDPVTCGDDGCDVDMTVPEIAAPVTVSGTVIDQRGRPLSRALVRARIGNVGGVEAQTIVASVLTNRNGQFRLRLPRGRGYQFTATAFD